METDDLKNATPPGPAPMPGAPVLAPDFLASRVSAVATMDPDPVQVGKWKIPPMTVKTAQLLERIDSPFVTPVLDPQTGMPVAVPPRITDVARALYIMLHQHDPRLLSLLDDRPAFERSVLEMSGTIDFAEMGRIARAIRETMTAVDQAIKAAGVEPSEKKEGASRI